MTCDILAIITIAKTVSGSIMNIMKSVVKGQIRSVNKSKSGWTMYTIVEKRMKCTCASVFRMHAYTLRCRMFFSVFAAWTVGCQ